MCGMKNVPQLVKSEVIPALRKEFKRDFAINSRSACRFDSDEESQDFENTIKKEFG